MKTLIIFLCLFLMGALIFCYTADYQGYMLEQNSLKAAAEECAAGAALAIDLEEFSRGRTVILRDEAVKYAAGHFENYRRKICRCDIKGWEMIVVISDDAGVYENRRTGSGRDNAAEDVNSQERDGAPEKGKNTYVSVELRVNTGSLVRVCPDLINEVCRTSVYELVKP